MKRILPLAALGLLLAGTASAEVISTRQTVTTVSNGGEPYCREYQQTIRVGGQVQHAYGTACQQPDGSWQFENGEPVTDLVAAPAVPAEPEQAYVVDEPDYYVPAPAPAPAVYGTVFVGSGHYGGWHGYHSRSHWHGSHWHH